MVYTEYCNVSRTEIVMMSCIAVLPRNKFPVLCNSWRWEYSCRLSRWQSAAIWDKVIHAPGAYGFLMHKCNVIYIYNFFIKNLVVLCYVYSDYVGVEAGAMSFIVD